MNIITDTQKQWVLSIHIFLVMTWLGTTVCLLVLSLAITGMKESESIHATYEVMNLLYQTLIRFAGPGSALSGLLLALLTRWGVFRFYWIMAKELLVLLTGGLSIFGVSSWVRQEVLLTAGRTFHASAFLTNHTVLVVGMIVQLIALTSVLLLALWKPWGQRRSHSLHRASRGIQASSQERGRL